MGTEYEPGRSRAGIQDRGDETEGRETGVEQIRQAEETQVLRGLQGNRVSRAADVNRRGGGGGSCRTIKAGRTELITRSNMQGWSRATPTGRRDYDLARWRWRS